MSFQAYLDTIEKKTGLTPRQLVGIAHEKGLEVVVTRNDLTSYESGLSGARRLLASETRPDGAFCVTDLIACGFMDAARHEFGLAIPDQLSVIGFGADPRAGDTFRTAATAPRGPPGARP